MKQGRNKRQLRPTLGAAHSHTFIDIISLELLYIQVFFLSKGLRGTRLISYTLRLLLECLS